MKSILRSGMAALLWLELAMFPPPALALQTVKGTEPAVVKISNRDLNRIVLPAKILKAYTSKTIEVKVEGSEAYVKIPPTVGGPVELYLLTEQETYTLLLVPAAVPAETVVIRDGQASLPAPESESYIQEIKSLLRSVANGLTPTGYDAAFIQDGKEECPVKECSLVAVRQYRGRRFMITEYHLSNPTKEPRTYDEGLFVKGNTRAVAVEQHQLGPGGITRLYRLEEVAP